MPRKTDKRERLVNAATLLMHKQGYDCTTLADIAQLADVPLGNVYYYFKTKEAIGEAVILGRTKEIMESLRAIDTECSSPVERLHELVNRDLADLEQIKTFGCPIGGLAQELAKKDNKLSEQAANLITLAMDWCQKQFVAIGHSVDQAKGEALQLIALMQGKAILTLTFHDENYCNQLNLQIHSWLSSLAGETVINKSSEEAIAV